MIADIIKIHSDFYYAKINDQVFECKIREKLKKEKIEVFVGDKVRIDEVNSDLNQAVITEVLERKNYIPRPSIANIDQIVIVAAINRPSLDFTQLNRYLAQAKIYDIPAVICINKVDIEDKDSIKEQISSIYQSLEYKIVFTSAKTGSGMEELENVFAGKRSILCGMSGVGKSSLLNKIHSELSLRTKNVSTKTERGIHTTRHVELIDIPIGNNTQVADAPGFSHLRFDNILPDSIDTLFDEIFELSQHCHYNNCLHLEESECHVKLNADKIAPSRYGSYQIFVKEALEYKEKLSQSGHKQERKFKNLDTKDKNKIKIIKLAGQSREKSRKTEKQKLSHISILEDEYYNNDKDAE